MPFPVTTAAVPAPPPATLRKVEHPDLSSVLTHFCFRNRPPSPALPALIRQMSAPERLASILWTQTLGAFVTFSEGAPAICMTETKQAGLEFLIGRRGYEPWALLFD